MKYERCIQLNARQLAFVKRLSRRAKFPRGLAIRRNSLVGTPSSVESFSDMLHDELVHAGFDAEYELTSEGDLIEGLIFLLLPTED